VLEITSVNCWNHEQTATPDVLRAPERCRKELCTSHEPQINFGTSTQETRRGALGAPSILHLPHLSAWLNEPVIAVVSAVQDIHRAFFGMREDEEVMTKKLHL